MPPREGGAQRAEHELLRAQSQPFLSECASQTAPTPMPSPRSRETVTLASGECRIVEIEVTEDREWDALLALAETATTLSLEQKDITHRTIAAIAALRLAHKDDWKPYCQRRGMKWQEAKSLFRPAVAWVLNLAKAKTGENHGSKASMVAGCIDEYWEIKRPSGMKPDEIPAWLSECGGYTKVYRDRLQRLREPKCNIGERYAEFLELKPVEEREIPDWLGGFSGEIIIAAHVDDVARKLQYRSVWRPEHPSFWHSRLEQFFAARRESSETVEAVCMPRDEPTTDPGPT
jgi:hypothetical protein